MSFTYGVDDPSDYAEAKRLRRSGSTSPLTRDEERVSSALLSQLEPHEIHTQGRLFDLPADFREYHIESGIIVDRRQILFNVRIGQEVSAVTQNLPERKAVSLTAIDQSQDPVISAIGFKDLIIVGKRALDQENRDRPIILLPASPFDQIRGENADRTIFLREDYWHHGIATRLFQTALTIARDLGAKRYEVAIAPECIDLGWYLDMRPTMREKDRLIFDLDLWHP